MAGNDKYLTKLTMGQGAGHDFSTAWFHDLGGNDTYECPGGCLGFAMYNGIGICWDEGGDDVYKTGASAFGATGETRPEICAWEYSSAAVVRTSFLKAAGPDEQRLGTARR